MAATSIPKTRLIKMILEDLKAEAAARKFFQITPITQIEDRLGGFTKNDLLEFIFSLGAKGEKALRELSSSFPIRRSPTLYIAIIENKPQKQELKKLLSSAKKIQGADAGMRFEEGATVRSIFLPNLGVNNLNLN